MSAAARPPAPPKPKPDPARRLARLQVLIDLARDLSAKLHDVHEEMAKIASGEPAMGDHMKTATFAWKTAWEARYKTGFVWDGPKDSAALKKLLHAIPVDEAVARMVRYIADTDKFYVEARHPFRLFVVNVNRYASVPTDLLSADAPTVEDCQHVPRCKSDQAHTRKRNAELRGQPT